MFGATTQYSYGAHICSYCIHTSGKSVFCVFYIFYACRQVAVSVLRPQLRRAPRGCYIIFWPLDNSNGQKRFDRSSCLAKSSRLPAPFCWRTWASRAGYFPSVPISFFPKEVNRANANFQKWFQGFRRNFLLLPTDGKNGEHSSLTLSRMETPFLFLTAYLKEYSRHHWRELLKSPLAWTWQCCAKNLSNMDYYTLKNNSVWSGYTLMEHSNHEHI